MKAEISARIEEAAGTLKRLPDRKRELLHERAQVWPLVLRRVWEDTPKSANRHQLTPTALQIDRMNEMLDYLSVLANENRNFFRSVWLCCAEGKKIAEAARIIGIDRSTARVWRDNGLNLIAGLIASCVERAAE